MLKVSADSVNSNRFGLALYQGESVDENNPLRLKWFSPSRLCHYKSGFSNTGQDRSQFTITAVPLKQVLLIYLLGNFTASASLTLFITKPKTESMMSIRD